MTPIAARAGLAVALIIFALACGQQWRYTIDDAFIVLTYAENLANGAGHVFYPGSRPVEGSTSPLWTLVGTIGVGLERLGLWQMPLGFKVAGAAAGAGAIVVVWRLSLLGSSPVARSLCAILLASYLPFGLWSVAGLETALAGFMVVLALAVTLAGKAPVPLVVVLHLTLFLTRPELALFSAILAALPLANWIAARRVDLRDLIPAIAYGGAVLAVTAIRLLYFGQWLPNSALAKGDIDVIAELPFGLELFGLFLRTQLFAVIAILAGIGVAGRTPGHLAIALVVLMFLAFVVAMGYQEMTHLHRLYQPVVPLLFALAAAGLTKVLRRPVLRWFAPAGIWPLVFSMGPAYEEIWHRPSRPYGLLDTIDEISRGLPVTRDFGLMLRRELPSDALLGSNDAGMVPYYSGLQTIDLRGLNDPRIAAKIRAAFNADDARAHADALYEYVIEIRNRNPDYLFEGYVPPALKASGWFQRCFELVPLDREYVFNERRGVTFVLHRNRCRGQ